MGSDICNYALNELNWEIDKSRPLLVEYVKKILMRKGRTLNICCEAGTNTVCLAQNEDDVEGEGGTRYFSTVFLMKRVAL